MKQNWQEYEFWQQAAQKTVILQGVYLLYILILTLKPFHFSWDYFFQHFKFEQGILMGLFSQLKLFDIVLNILFFIPYGLLTGLLARLKGLPKEKAIKKIILYSLFVSALAEICQLFSIRSSSLFDILMNVLGGFIGGLWSFQINLQRSNFIKFILNRGSRFVRTMAWGYLLFLIIAFSLPFWLNRLANWNENFHLILGNEATGDRPWAGTFYKVAIYDRMLTDTEILQCYYQRCPNTVRPHLLALYSFEKDSGELISDLSRLKPGLDLKIYGQPAVKWPTQTKGLTISSGSYLKSENPAIKIARHLKKSNQFSVEILFESENLTQTGPARIITFSGSTDERNFTLGQVGQNLNFRVRTPLTGLNGSKIDLFVEQPVLKTEKQHIMAIYNHGAEQIFLNGKLLESSIFSISHYIPFLLGFGRNWLGKICFVFLLIFPLGWMMQLARRRRGWKILWGLFKTILPVIITQFIFSIFYHQPIDLPIILVAVGTSLGVLLLSLISFPFKFRT